MSKIFSRKNGLKRKPILLGKKEDIEDKEDLQENSRENSFHINNMTIAIAGTHRGCGCTHISLLTAYQLSKEYKVALVEMDSKADLHQFDLIYDLKIEQNKARKLDQLDVYFYKETALTNVFKEGYDYIVLDMGAIINVQYDNEANQIETTIADNFTEAYRASRRILVTQVKEWQQRYLAEFVNRDNSLNQWTIVTNLTNKKNYKELVALFRNKDVKDIVNMPYIDEVFNTNNENIIAELLGEILE